MNVASLVKPVKIEKVRVSSSEIAGWHDGFGANVMSRTDFEWEDEKTVKVTVRYFALFPDQSSASTFILMGDHWRRLFDADGKPQLGTEKFQLLWTGD